MNENKSILLFIMWVLTLGVGTILGMLLVMTEYVPELNIQLLATIGYWCEVALLVILIVGLKDYEIQVVPKHDSKNNKNK